MKFPMGHCYAVIWFNGSEQQVRFHRYQSLALGDAQNLKRRLRIDLVKSVMVIFKGDLEIVPCDN